MDEGISLLARLTAVNGIVLALVAVLLLASPITIDAPPTLGQATLVVGGLVVILVGTSFALRRPLAPLQTLAEEIRLVDPDRPGRLDLDVPSERELAALAEAFDEILARLADERHERVRVALAAQE